MATAVKVEHNRDRLTDLALKCYEQASHHHEQAKQLLVKALKKDPVLLDKALMQYARWVISHALLQENQNRDIRRMNALAMPSIGLDPAKESALRVAGEELLKEFVKPVGTFLQNLTREQLLSVADERDKQTITMRRRTRFYRLLAEGMHEGQKVKDRYTPKELLNLRIQAEKEITE